MLLKYIAKIFIYKNKWLKRGAIYLYTLAISPSLGAANNTKNNKNHGGSNSGLLVMMRDPAEFG